MTRLSKDRLYGAALPSTLSKESIDRIATKIRKTSQVGESPGIMGADQAEVVIRQVLDSFPYACLDNEQERNAITVALEEADIPIYSGEIPNILSAYESLCMDSPDDKETLVRILMNQVDKVLDDVRSDEEELGGEASHDETMHMASLQEIPTDFQKIGSGFYRQGHRIWELRAAEDEKGGYVLTRKREELAVDMRTPSAKS